MRLPSARISPPSMSVVCDLRDVNRFSIHTDSSSFDSAPRRSGLSFSLSGGPHSVFIVIRNSFFPQPSTTAMATCCRKCPNYCRHCPSICRHCPSTCRHFSLIFKMKLSSQVLGGIYWNLKRSRPGCIRLYRGFISWRNLTRNITPFVPSKSFHKLA